ncbi:MAG: 4Fe-4S ferredoxin [Deltaproteobacteria bacterium GWC2_56_8]|nr:MAG: 4Fe-4S ferredoxin [Deltaproteobacteria bacterium GWB2_55_19]OGP36682.1 MAG: 4Fe-4S ferredoxin [Deltaproteobacteria bacterium GWC2_56_8]
MTSIISAALIVLAIALYLSIISRKSKKVKKKVALAEEYGFREPTTIHPKIDPSKCIGSGACVKACPEKDIIGLIGGKGGLINASHCVGHGACAEACPVGAIALVFGTETRGVDIPHLTPDFETNIKGIFIAGELGGMGLIKNAITQGREAVEYISCRLGADKGRAEAYDVIIIGAGPAGVGASLMASKKGLKFVTIEQGDVGGTVFNYPRHKIVMTSPVELPLYGSVRLRETTKEALLDLWTSVIKKTGLEIRTGEKMTGLAREADGFRVKTSKGEYPARNVILAIGRRGTPRKLDVPGEKLPKVTYSLLDPEQHRDHHLLVVGGGDSAIEAAIALAKQPGNKVSLSYRSDSFKRIKPMNKTRLDEAVSKKSVTVILNSNVKEIREKDVRIETEGKEAFINNDYVYIFAGGELPNEFLLSIGVRIEKKFGTE